jgi:preprotein translocase subunit SecF
MIRIFHHTRYDFIRWWRAMALGTAAFIALGLGSMLVTGGLRYSIEFTGGTLMQLEFKQRPTSLASAARSTARRRGAEIQQYGSPTEFTVRAQDEAQVAEQGPARRAVGRRIQRRCEQRFGATRSAWCAPRRSARASARSCAAARSSRAPRAR